MAVASSLAVAPDGDGSDRIRRPVTPRWLAMPSAAQHKQSRDLN